MAWNEGIEQHGTIELRRATTARSSALQSGVVRTRLRRTRRTERTTLISPITLSTDDLVEDVDGTLLLLQVEKSME